MIDIILVGGNGRMGKAIREILLSREYKVGLEGIVVQAEEEVVSPEVPVYHSVEEAIKRSVSKHRVIIDFSTVENTLHTISIAAEHSLPVVIGTTGFSREENKIIEGYSKDIPILLSSNMSRGITALLRVLPLLVEYLGEEYDAELVELHHKRKKDAPSGTALSLANCLAKAKGWDMNEVFCYHREGIIGERPKKEIGVQTVRGGGIAGTHTVFFLGEDEHIEITHRATSRATFARGAIYASMWLYGKEAGLYSMLDVE